MTFGSKRSEGLPERVRRCHSRRTEKDRRGPMTLRDVGSDVIRRQEPAQAQHAIWAERARLLRTDRLTGLSNRLGWDESLDEAMFSASRFGGPLVVARIDLDQASSQGAAVVEPVVRFAGRARRVVRNADLF